MTESRTPSPAADAAVGTPDKDNLARRLADAWHKTVGPWATDDKGTASLVGRLVDFKTLSADEARRVLLEAKKRVDENRVELDRRVDDSWHRAQAFFSSEQKDIRKLEDRIAQLEARLKDLTTS